MFAYSFGRPGHWNSNHSHQIKLLWIISKETYDRTLYQTLAAI
jgi:hypothetical protein